jgi:hypothetical protein
MRFRCCAPTRPGCGATRSRRTGSGASRTRTGRPSRGARCLVYLEDQYLWSRPVAEIIASAMRDNPGLHVIAVVPRYPDTDGTITQMPGVLARNDVERARSPGTCACGYGASTSTVTKTTWMTSCSPRRPSRHSGGRPSCSPRCTTAAGPGPGPRADIAESASQAHNSGTAMGDAAVPDDLRSGRPPVAGQAARQALTAQISRHCGGCPFRRQSCHPEELPGCRLPGPPSLGRSAVAAG